MTPEASPAVFGVLHPGAMGASVGAILTANGHRVLWASDGRSDATRRRARDAGLEDVASVDAVCDQAQVLLSICPPHAAMDLARTVAATGFAGVFVDANAIAPATAVAVLAELGAATAVDGGLVGPPPERAGATRLFLAGDGTGGAADEAASALATSLEHPNLEVLPLDRPAPAASALKVAYAAWTKGSTALLYTVRAYARAAGIEEALVAEWARSQPGLDDRCHRSAPATAAKGWRFSGELREIAAALGSAGLPDGFHTGGAEVYQRLAPLKDHTGAVDLDTLLRTLMGERSR